MKIEISDETYKRLGSLVNGFETPEDVITRIMDSYENQSASQNRSKNTITTNTFIQKPLIIFLPNESIFTDKLLTKKECWQTIIYTNGNHRTKKWNASNLSENSSIRGNLWSGVLRHWKKQGIAKLLLTIEEPTNHQIANHL